ncbi:MAG TPA: hypothetical protein VIR02_04755, partial [Anaerolineales bacterium]
MLASLQHQTSVVDHPMLKNERENFSDEVRMAVTKKAAQKTTTKVKSESVSETNKDISFNPR